MSKPVRRPGDNVSMKDLLEETPDSHDNNPPRVMFGGCGYGAGSFHQLVVKKRPRLDLLSLLGIRRKTKNEE